MFVDFFIRRPVFASVCSIIIVLVGAVSIPLLPVDYYPQVAPPAVRVTAVYPGADAETVETAVTNVLEQEINGVEGIRYISSVSSSNGTSQITVTFSPDRDLDTAAVDVQNRVARVQARLPAEVIQNGLSVEKAGDSAFVQVVALRSEAGEYDELFVSNYAELFVRDALRRIRGVSDVIVFGERTYAMRIWLDPTRLAGYGLTALDVVNAVRQQNIQVPAGQIGSQPSPPDQEVQISVQATGRLSQPEEFAQIVLKASPDGSLVRIADVGRVELGAQSYDTFFRIGGQEAVGIAITKQPDANALEVSRQVRQTLAELSRSFPPGLIYEIAFDATLFITESVQEVIFTLLQAIVLVVLVLFIFLQDWRITLIPTVTIPVALLGTFAFVRLFGFSINTLTMFGLTLATGLVVDDTIVVVENISRYIRDRGMRPLQGASAGMNEVLGAVIATTLVLLGLFVPIAFFPGTSGRIYRQFAVTIAVSVSLSTFNAITLAPALSALLIRPRSEQMFWLLRWFDRAVEGIRAAYRRFLELVVKLRLLVVAGFVACLGLTYWLFQVVPTGFVPDEDQGFFITIIQGPPGVSLNYTDRVIRQASAILDGIPEIENQVIVGGFSFTGPSPGNGLIFATLKPWDERRRPEQSAQAIVNRLFGPFLGGISRSLVIPILPPAIPDLGVTGGFTFQLQDRGVNDFNLLQQTANTLFFVGNAPPPPGQPPPWQRPCGQVIIGAAVLDDVLGIIILAVVASLAKTGEVDVADVGLIVVSAVVFLVGSIVLGRLLSPYFVALLNNLKARGNPLLPALVLAFLLAYVGQVIHLEAILGAFAAGLILGETDKRQELEEQIKPVSDLLVPIFFVCVGAKTNLAVLNPTLPANREGLIIAVFLVSVAIVGKLAAGLGAFGKPGINRYAIGVGMIPRGEVGLVFAGVGAASGVLSEALDVSIIVMVIATTFIAPLWLRGVLIGEVDSPPSLLDLQAEASEQDRVETPSARSDSEQVGIPES